MLSVLIKTVFYIDRKKLVENLEIIGTILKFVTTPKVLMKWIAGN